MKTTQQILDYCRKLCEGTLYCVTLRGGNYSDRVEIWTNGEMAEFTCNGRVSYLRTEDYDKDSEFIAIVNNVQNWIRTTLPFDE